MSDVPAKPKHPGGRPSIYSPELAATICERIACTSFGLRKLCEMYDDMPHMDTVYAWKWRHKEFSVMYAEAKLKQADLMAEEIIDIADNGSNDWMEACSDKGEGWVLNGEHVNRSRLRIDTRKWLASKLLPRAYGDKTEEKKPNDLSVIELMLEKISSK